MSSVVVIRLLSLALLVAVALNVGTVVGVLVWVDTAKGVSAIIQGGAAAGATVLLGVSVWSALRPLS